MGRIIVLLLLIVVLAAGGLIWFDYLNIIDVKTTLSPVFNALRGLPVIGRVIPSEGRSKPPADPSLNLDVERVAVRLESLELQRRELEQREQDLTSRQGQIEQMAEELADRQKSLEEQENSIKSLGQDAEVISRNVEQNARYLTNMPPLNAVGILAAMDDQLIIDVFRKTEEIAQQEGASSMVPVWLMNMDPVRAAELQRKMALKPSSP